MSAEHNVEIRITAQNLADPAFQQAIADLKSVATTAESVSARTKAAGAGVKDMSTSAASAAGTYKQLANDLNTATQKADAAKAAFQGAARAVEGGQSLGGGMFPELARGAQQAETELKQLQTTARETAGTLDQVHTSSGNAGGGFLQMAGNIGSVVTGLAFGAQMLSSFVQSTAHGAMSILSLNANLEQTDVAFKQLLGSQSAADTFVKQLQSFAAATPFEFPQLSKAAQQLLGVGMAAKDIIPDMTAIGDAVAAFGGSAAQIDEVTLALTQMQSKGKIEAQEMLQLTNAQIPGWQILAKVTGLTVEQLQKLSQAGKLTTDTYLPKLISGMEQLYGGNMQAQALTFNGELSTLTDNLRQAATIVTKPFFDEAKSGLQSFVAYTSTAAFGTKVQQWADESKAAAQDLAAWVQANGPGIFDGIKTGAENAVTAMKIITTTLDTIATSPEVTITVNVVRKVINAVPKEENTPPAQPAVNAGPSGNTFVPTPTKPNHGAIYDAFALAAKPANAILDLFDKTDKELTFLDKLQHNYYQTSATDMAHLTELAQSHNDTYKRRAQYVLDEINQYHAVIGIAQLYFHQEQEIDRLQSSQHSAGISGADLQAAEARNKAFQDHVRVVNVAIDADQKYNAQMNENVRNEAVNTQHLRQVNMDTLDYVSTLSKQQQALLQEGEATALVRDAQGRLASTYQVGLTLMGEMQTQGQQYTSMQSAMAKAYDIIQQKKKDGIPLDEREQTLLNDYPQLYGRLTGGIQDAAEGAGLYAAANTEVMLAQDALNDAINRGESNLQPYEDRLRNAQEIAGNSQFADPMTQSLNTLSSTISTVLVPALDTLKQYIADLSGSSFTITGKVVVDTSGMDVYLAGQGYGSPHFSSMGAGAGVSPGPASPAQTPPPAPSGNGGGSTREQMSPLAYTDSRQLASVFGDGPPMQPIGGNAGPKMTGDPPPAGIQPNAVVGAETNRDAVADITRLMGDASQQFSTDYLDHLKAYTDAASSALSLYQDAAKLATDSSLQSVQMSDGMRKAVDNLKQIAEYATTATGDSAALFSGDYLKSVKDYSDAASAAVGLLSTTLQFTKDMGDRVVLFGDWQKRNIGNLKFIAEESTRSVGDSAQLFGSGYLAQLKVYSDAAKGALDVESAALSFTKDMGGDVIQFGDWQKRNVANLKFLAEDSTRSVGDSAALFDGPYLASTKTYADAAKSGLEMLTSALQLSKDLGDTVVQYGPWQERALGNLKFLAEFATRSVGDSAAMFDGPYLEAAGTYADAAGKAISLLSSSLQLQQSLGDKIIAFGPAEQAALATLKQLAEQATRDVGDSAKLFDAGYLKDAGDYADAASKAVQLLSTSLQLQTGLATATATYGPQTAAAVDALKRLAEASTRSVGDSAQLFDKDYLAAAGTYADAASKAVGLLKSALDLQQSLKDKVIAYGPDQHAMLTVLSTEASDAAQLIGDAAKTMDHQVIASVTAYADAASKSIGLLSDTANLVKSLTDPSVDPTIFATDMSVLFRTLAADALIAGQAAASAAKNWDSSANQGITDFTDAAGKSLTLLGNVVDVVKSIAELPQDLPDVNALAGSLVATATIVSQAVSDARSQWDQLVANGQAIPIADIAAWADGAGKAVSLVGDVANAYKAMADMSTITQRDTSVFKHNWQTIMDMIPDLLEISRGHLRDAQEFKTVAELIAKEFQDAASAIQTVTGSKSGSGGASGGLSDSGGAGAVFKGGASAWQALMDKAAKSAGGSLSPAALAGQTGSKLGINEFLAKTLGWSTDTQTTLNNGVLEVHHTIDTSVLSQAIQYQASLLPAKFDKNGNPNNPLDRTYADEFLSLLQIMQANSDIFGKGQQDLIVQGLKKQLGALGLTNDAALGKALFGSMGLTPDVLKNMGLDKKTIDDLTNSMGKSFLDGTANPVADATGAAVSAALTTGMQPFADTVGKSTYQAVTDAAAIQAQIMADAVERAVARSVKASFDEGLQRFAQQLTPAA